jgi:hypothetical protein
MNWWWRRLDDWWQATVAIVLPTLIIGIALIVAGPSGLLFLGGNSILLIFAPIVSVLSIIGIRLLIGTIRNEYSIFREENPTEAEQIISKLKGIK